MSDRFRFAVFLFICLFAVLTGVVTTAGISPRIEDWVLRPSLPPPPSATPAPVVVIDPPLTPAEEAAFLQQVAAFKKNARLASSGALGCGPSGTLYLLTSRGRMGVPGASGDIGKVFPSPIRTGWLLTLLRERGKFVRTGGDGPMADPAPEEDGPNKNDVHEEALRRTEARTLCALCVEALSYSEEPEAVPMIAELLHDRSYIIRHYAFQALNRLGNANLELRAKVEEIEIPSMDGKAGPPVKMKVVPPDGQ